MTYGSAAGTELHREVLPCLNVSRRRRWLCLDSSPINRQRPDWQPHQRFRATYGTAPTSSLSAGDSRRRSAASRPRPGLFRHRPGQARTGRSLACLGYEVPVGSFGIPLRPDNTRLRLAGVAVSLRIITLRLRRNDTAEHLRDLGCPDTDFRVHPDEDPRSNRNQSARNGFYDSADPAAMTFCCPVYRS